MQKSLSVEADSHNIDLLRDKAHDEESDKRNPTQMPVINPQKVADTSINKLDSQQVKLVNDLVINPGSKPVISDNNKIPLDQTKKENGEDSPYTLAHKADDGLTQSSNKNYQQALTIYAEILRALEKLYSTKKSKLPNPKIIPESYLFTEASLIVYSHCILGELYKFKGNKDLAIQNYNKALELLNKIDTKNLNAFKNMAQALNEISSMQTKIKSFLEPNFKSNTTPSLGGIDQMILGFVTSIGHLYRTQSKFDTALEYFTRALELKESLSSTPDLELYYLNYYIGKIYIKMSEFYNATEYYTKANNILLNLDSKSKSMQDNALLCLALGSAHSSQASHEMAQIYYSAALEILEAIQPKPEALLNSCYTKLGMTAKGLGKIDEAMKYYQKAQDLLKRLFPSKDTIEWAILSTLIGTAYVGFGDEVKALECFNEAVTLLLKLDQPESKLFLQGCYENIALIKETEKKIDEALANYHLCENVREEIYGPKHLQTKKLYHRLALIYFTNKKDYVKSEEYTQKYKI